MLSVDILTGLPVGLSLNHARLALRVDLAAQPVGGIEPLGSDVLVER